MAPERYELDAVAPNITGTAWTDDYSNVLGALVFTNDLSF